jgi:hypothetical protein
MPLIWRERSTSEFPMMSFLSFGEEPTTKCLLLKQKVASDMSDLSYEKELGEVGEGGKVNEGPLQHCRKLTT